MCNLFQRQPIYEIKPHEIVIFWWKSGIDRIEKSLDDDSTGLLLRSFRTIAIVYLPRAPARMGHREVLPCLTLAFETIDKARLRNSLAEYVTHLPRMINLSGERSWKRRPLRRNHTWTNRHDETRTMALFSSHREYVEKSMRERTRKFGPVGPWKKLAPKLWLESNLPTISFLLLRHRLFIKTIKTIYWKKISFLISVNKLFAFQSFQDIHFYIGNNQNCFWKLIRLIIFMKGTNFFYTRSWQWVKEWSWISRNKFVCCSTTRDMLHHVVVTRL